MGVESSEQLLSSLVKALLAILLLFGTNKRSRAAGMLSHHRPAQGHLWSWDKPRRTRFFRTAAHFASDGIPPTQMGQKLHVHTRTYTYDPKTELAGVSETTLNNLDAKA